MSEAVFLANVNKQMNENLEDQIKPAVANFKRGHVPSIIWMPENKEVKYPRGILNAIIAKINLHTFPCI